MKISVAVVMSLDAKITRHDEANVKQWASPEDQQHLYKLISEHDAIVMGSGTYEAYKDSLQLEADRLRVVLTSKVPSYEHQSIPGSLEFSSETPQQLVDRLESHDFKRLLVAGGPRMIGEFLQYGLVNKLYVTIEPRLFGHGKPLITDVPIDIQLRLIKHEPLNPNGTMLLTYKVN